jgi:tRNA threonylcarbamoyl adenosine modification protein YjeE
MSDHQHHFLSHSPEATTSLACSIATNLVPGDVLLLEGPIGAGKSHFSRAAIQHMLTCPEDVPSPTYTLVQTYEGENAEIWHADLYRLTDASEVHELGLVSAFEDAICFVEWPDRLAEDIPQNALTLEFRSLDDSDTRDITLSWTDPRWITKLEGILA